MSGSSDASPRHDGDSLYLTDTAYFALLDHESRDNRMSFKTNNKQDGLFLERLESFIDGQQKEMESFANREQRSVDEIRKLVAIPHAKYLFSLDPNLPQRDASPQDNDSHIPSIRSTLARLSSTLQMLHSAAGLDSLLLVVSPLPTTPPVTSSTPVSTYLGTHHHSSVSSEYYETSWIGGTDLGKEFWMGLKGGGVNGARAFRVKCQMWREAEASSPDMDASPAATSNGLPSNPIQTSGPDLLPTSKMRSGDVKTELNAAVRHALRAASGKPSAEMRWTKPASLEESYNVRLIGWPPSVHMRNPSSNSLKNNRLLLDLLRSGKMKFVQKGSPGWSTSPAIIRHANLNFTGETVPQNKSSVAPVRENPPSVSLHSSVVDSSKSSALSVEPGATVQQCSQPSSHISSSLCYPSSSRTAGLVEPVSASIPVASRLSSRDTSPSGSIAPKRPVESYTPERDTQNGREVKRAKLDAVDAVG